VARLVPRRQKIKLTKKAAGDPAIRADRDAAHRQELVNIDKMTRAVPESDGSHLFLAAQYPDVPHTLNELDNLLAGRERTDN